MRKFISKLIFYLPKAKFLIFVVMMNIGLKISIQMKNRNYQNIIAMRQRKGKQKIIVINKNPQSNIFQILCVLILVPNNTNKELNDIWYALEYQDRRINKLVEENNQYKERIKYVEK